MDELKEVHKLLDDITTLENPIGIVGWERVTRARESIAADRYRDLHPPFRNDEQFKRCCQCVEFLYRMANDMKLRLVRDKKNIIMPHQDRTHETIIDTIVRIIRKEEERQKEMEEHA